MAHSCQPQRKIQRCSEARQSWPTAARMVIIVAREEEIELWTSDTYRVGFDKKNGEMVYRVKIPMEKLRKMI